MLEIKQTDAFSKYNMTAVSPDGSELHIVEAVTGEYTDGMALFGYDKDTVKIYSVDSGIDLLLCDGLVRTVMLKASMRGIKTIHFCCEDKTEMIMLKKLHFIENDSLSADIDDFMGGCGHCSMNKTKE